MISQVYYFTAYNGFATSASAKRSRLTKCGCSVNGGGSVPKPKNRMRSRACGLLKYGSLCASAQMLMGPHLQNGNGRVQMGSGLLEEVGISAHIGRQVLTLKGQTCSLFGSPALLMKLAWLGRNDKMRDEIANLSDLRFGVLLCFHLHFSLFLQD